MISILLVSLVAVLVAASAASVWWATRGRNELHAPPEHGPPISVLKPLCGVDDGLADNLDGFFQLDHPQFELVFGVRGQDDPAAAVVRGLRRKYPRVPCQLVIHGGGRGLNPKVDNLRAMLEVASHDRVVISDSNVAVRPDYLSAMSHVLDEPGVGLVTSPIVGVAERGLGATLESLQLNGTIAGSVAASALLGRTLVVGKSMMFSRTAFEALGGFAAVANLLAEDYIIGRMFRLAGYRVRLCPQPVLNVVGRHSLKQFFLRHQRWSMLRTRLKPLVYPLEFLANPMSLALLAPWLGMGLWPLALGPALSMGRDGLQWLRLRGPHGLLKALFLSPIKDSLGLVIWLLAPLRRHVGWRGKRLRLSAGTWLYASAPMGAASPISCE